MNEIRCMLGGDSTEDESYCRLPMPKRDDEGNENSFPLNEKQVVVKSKKKRPPLTSQSDTNQVGDFPTPEYATNSRSDGKRLREQNRRNECNRGLDQLMALLIDIDPDIKALAEYPVKARRGAKHSANVQGKIQLLGRAELISRTVSVLDQLHRKNKEQQLIIEQLHSMLRSGDFGCAAPSGSDQNDENPEDFKMTLLEMPCLPDVDCSLHHHSLHVGTSIIVDEQMAKVGSPSADMVLLEQLKHDIMLAGMGEE